MMGCTVKCRSWMWQKQNLPEAAVALQPALRLVVENGPVEFLKVAAAEGLWDMKLSFLDKLAQHAGLEVLESTGNLCEILFHMVKHILGCDDAVAVAILAKRLAWNYISVMFAAELMQVDEAVEVMEVRDRVFALDFKQKTTSVRVASANSGAKQKSKPTKRPPKQGLPSEIAQSSAKPFFVRYSQHLARQHTFCMECTHATQASHTRVLESRLSVGFASDLAEGLGPVPRGPRARLGCLPLAVRFSRRWKQQ
mmetsp:Transcript_110224/g.351307  ORF Transcript_110224/g.351307 Transcript_110224/m.351307 type:complete len:253 (+) Transcript_110224:3700-4458(+)